VPQKKGGGGVLGGCHREGIVGTIIADSVVVKLAVTREAEASWGPALSSGNAMSFKSENESYKN